MERKELCQFGKSIEKKLVDMNKKQLWLIEEVKKDTGKYFDRSYLHKIEVGELATPGIISSISKILEIPSPK